MGYCKIIAVTFYRIQVPINLFNTHIAHAIANWTLCKANIIANSMFFMKTVSWQ